MSKVRITITIDEDLLESIDRIAGKLKENRSSLIERFLRGAVAEEEMMLSPMVRHMLSSAMASPQVVESLRGALRNEMEERHYNVVADKLDRMQSVSMRAARLREEPHGKKE
jgi:metal-responsive CopG/Arc/MetJ family transcriptional regulator